MYIKFLLWNKYVPREYVLREVPNTFVFACHFILLLDIVKFKYSEKAIKCCKISTVDLTGTTYIGQIFGGDFAKFCGLLRMRRRFPTDV